MSADVKGGFDYAKFQEKLDELAKKLNKDPSERETARLFWRDDMESYVQNKWLTEGGATVSYVTTGASSEPPFEGDAMLEMNNATSDRKIVKTNYFGPLKPQKISVELKWLRRPLTYRFELLFYSADGKDPNDARGGRIRWGTRSIGGAGWMYMLSSGAFADIGGGVESIITSSWNHLKVIMDLKNKVITNLETNYLSLENLNIEIFPLSATSVFRRGAGYFQLYIYVNSAINTPDYIDDFRIYLNEV